MAKELGILKIINQSINKELQQFLKYFSLPVSKDFISLVLPPNQGQNGSAYK